MTFDRTTGIDTPEGVRLDLTLAGLGSRAGAQILDSLVKFVAWLTVSVVILGNSGFETFFAGQGLLFLLFFYLYEMIFEGAWSGRTPGKRAFRIRVISADGGPARLGAVAVRNLLRIVDFLPFFYAAATVAIFSSKRHQRFGDMAAGTVVVRESAAPDRRLGLSTVRRFPVPEGFDATAVTPQEVAVIRRLLDRAADLDPVVVQRLAGQVAEPIRPKVHVPGRSMTDLDLLRAIAAFKDR